MEWFDVCHAERAGAAMRCSYGVAPGLRAAPAFSGTRACRHLALTVHALMSRFHRLWHNCPPPQIIPTLLTLLLLLNCPPPPQIIPILRDGMASPEATTRQGVCNGLKEVMENATRTQLADHLADLLAPIQVLIVAFLVTVLGSFCCVVRVGVGLASRPPGGPAGADSGAQSVRFGFGMLAAVMGWG